MAPVLNFRTDNYHGSGICTGMSISWAKTCLIRRRAPNSKLEMGLGHSIVAELGQKKYVNQSFVQLLANKSLIQENEKSRKAKWYTSKKKRFKNAAYDVLRSPGVYLICTQDHTMAASYFPVNGVLAYLDPNDGQYTFDNPSEFPGWYWSHVHAYGYDLSDSLLLKIGL